MPKPSWQVFPVGEFPQLRQIEKKMVGTLGMWLVLSLFEFAL
jgi:hypothetical protein